MNDLRKIIDWEVIQNEYITGYFREDRGDALFFPEIADLIRRHDLNEAQADILFARVAEEGWKLKRISHQQRIANIQKQRKASDLAQDRDRFDTDCFKIAEVGINQIKVHIMQYIRQQQAVPINELEKLARTFQRFQVAGKLSLGDKVKDLTDMLEVQHLGAEEEQYDLASLDKEELKLVDALLNKVKEIDEEPDGDS